MLRDGVVEALEPSGDEARERALRRVVVDAECHAVAGRWRSVYDGCVLRRASAVEIHDGVRLAKHLALRCAPVEPRRP